MRRTSGSGYAIQTTSRQASPLTLLARRRRIVPSRTCLFADARPEMTSLWCDRVSPSLTASEQAHVHEQTARLSVAGDLHERAAMMAREAGWVAPTTADGIAAACREGLALLTG